MVFTLTSQMYHKISVLVLVLLWVPEYLSTSTSTSTMTLELTSTSTVRVPEIQYSSTASTSTEYEYPSPAYDRPSYLHNGICYTDKKRSLYWIKAQISLIRVKLILMDFHNMHIMGCQMNIPFAFSYIGNSNFWYW